MTFVLFAGSPTGLIVAMAGPCNGRAWPKRCPLRLQGHLSGLQGCKAYKLVHSFHVGQYHRYPETVAMVSESFLPKRLFAAAETAQLFLFLHQILLLCAYCSICQILGRILYDGVW